MVTAQEVKKMKSYIIKRILISIVVFFGITVLVFLLSNMLPGSPEDFFRTPKTREEDLVRIRAFLGVDQPIPIQYFKWLGRLFTGNFGYSYRTGTSISGLLKEKMTVSLMTGGVSLVVTVIFAVPLGIWAAYRAYSKFDYATSWISYIFSSIPDFFLGLVLIFIFVVTFRIFPVSGLHTVGEEESLGDLARHLVLPVICLSSGNIALLFRQTRSSMLDTFHSEYVRMARFKGLSERIVIFRHVLRNAAAPIVTTISTLIMVLVSGSIVVEQMFTIPGIGNLMMQSVLAHDYPVIMAVTVIVAIVVLVINLLQDIVYCLLDPRVKYE